MYFGARRTAAAAVTLTMAACAGGLDRSTTGAPSPTPPPPVTTATTPTTIPGTRPALPSSVTPSDRAVLVTRRVNLYGDSLAWEAQDAFRAALGGAGVGDVVTRTFGGTAICDWLDQMRRDQQQMHPDAVVVEFSGNAFTACMKDGAGTPLTGDALVEKYFGDALAVLEIFGRDATPVYFVSAPISRRAEQTHDPQVVRLNASYASIAASHSSARFIDAGAAVEDHGRWTNALPCLPQEPCEGGVGPSGQPVNVVRAPDGIHFCPGAPGAVDGVTGTCPVWSSGAYRYGTAMADPIPLDLSHPRASE